MITIIIGLQIQETIDWPFRVTVTIFQISTYFRHKSHYHKIPTNNVTIGGSHVGYHSICYTRSQYSQIWYFSYFFQVNVVDTSGVNITYWATLNGDITGITTQGNSLFVIVESTCSVYQVDDQGFIGNCKSGSSTYLC
jgi:hypothetical protein